MDISGGNGGNPADTHWGDVRVSELTAEVLRELAQAGKVQKVLLGLNPRAITVDALPTVICLIIQMLNLTTSLACSLIELNEEACGLKMGLTKLSSLETAGEE